MSDETLEGPSFLGTIETKTWVIEESADTKEFKFLSEDGSYISFAHEENANVIISSDANGDQTSLDIQATDVTMNNLHVTNTMTVTEVKAITTEDVLIHLAKNNSQVDDTYDQGIFGEYNNQGVKFWGLYRDASDNGVFKLQNDITTQPDTNVEAGIAAILEIGQLRIGSSQINEMIENERPFLQINGGDSTYMQNNLPLQYCKLSNTAHAMTCSNEQPTVFKSKYGFVVDSGVDSENDTVYNTVFKINNQSGSNSEAHDICYCQIMISNDPMALYTEIKSYNATQDNNMEMYFSASQFYFNGVVLPDFSSFPDFSQYSSGTWTPEYYNGAAIIQSITPYLSSYIRIGGVVSATACFDIVVHSDFGPVSAIAFPITNIPVDMPASFSSTSQAVGSASWGDNGYSKWATAQLYATENTKTLNVEVSFADTTDISFRLNFNFQYIIQV